MVDGGTREGFILVSRTPPKPARARRPAAKAAGNGPAASANGPTATANGERRRDELADFLRKRRASLQPADVGLNGGGRRRTPGLRREEVAALAGVGTTWYTWLEQGRDVRASFEVLEAIAGALRLTPAERTHLMLLGRGESPPAHRPPPEKASPTLSRVVENLGGNPAWILGRRWDYLAWNRAATVILGDFSELPKPERNHVWLTFMDPARRELFSDWETAIRLMVARFRADSAHHVGDASFEELIGKLKRASPEFCKLWKRHEVAGTGPGRKELNHPVAGRLVFEHAVFNPAEAPEQRLVLYSPLPEEDTPAKLAGLLA